ncbi:hypothetical protein [Campylobacter sp.]|nr:hypothetical protein [Campylobacter sp.]MBQ8819235.1 hypothetical protein [Campylobacter sp.]
MQNEVLGISIGLAIKGIGEISKVNSPFANLKAKLEFKRHLAIFCKRLGL